MNLITKANRMCFTKRQYRSLIVAHCAIGKIMGRDPRCRQVSVASL
jgi:hypothetical protein